MVAEEVMGMDSSKDGTKRSFVEQGTGSRGSGGKGTAPSMDTLAIMGSLPARVGKGEHEKPLLEAMVQGMRDLAMDVTDLKGAFYMSWELPRDPNYVTRGMEYKEAYGKACRDIKGKGQNIGHQKNYVFMGLFIALKEDKDVSEEDQKTLEKIIGSKLRDSTTNTLSLKEVKSISGIIGHCQVVRPEKKGFINLHFKGPEGMVVQKRMEEAMDREGDRQGDGGPPKPVFRDLEDALAKARAGN